MNEQVPGGYNGKILRVNLSDNNISEEAIDELFCRKYLGGAGFIAYFLWKELKQGVDPLGPDNKLIFAAGPVTGVPLPGSGRHCIGAKSPLTSGYAKEESGGFWGAEFKHAGYDAIIVEGKAEKPVYLWIQDGKASLKDASHLWGKNTKETQETIRDELGDSLIRVTSIGPGGENMVRFACIMNDLNCAAGRGGMGAVMGSKNLKAIAVRGHKRLKVADPEHIKEIRQGVAPKREAPHDFDTVAGATVEASTATGNIPVRNFLDGEFPEISKASAEAIRDKIGFVEREACYACPLRCKKGIKVDEPYLVDPAYGSPGYEALVALGPNCGVSDTKAIAKGSELCNAYTIDCISTGVTIAFAMECFENGLLTIKDTGGIELRFGNAEAMLKIIELIARREGIGDLLAEGSARAAQKIGKGAEKFAMHVKGVEIPMHEPRLRASMGLGYAVNPAGADHMVIMKDTDYSQQGAELDKVKPLGIIEPIPADDLGPRKVAAFRDIHLFHIALDSLVLCMFLPYGTQQIADILAAVTGWNTGLVELLRVSERTLTMARAFNIREGLGAADDRLPDRFFQPKRNGVLSTKHYSREKLEKAKSYYYTLMGWDAQTGVPTPETLEALSIDK